MIVSVDKIYLVFLNLDEWDIIICIIVIENLNIIYKIGSVS